MNFSPDNPIRLGLFGVGASLGHSARGLTLAQKLERIPELELAAVCDTNEEKVNHAAASLSVAGYTEFDRFLEHDLDAVLLANYFHEHAPFAIRALQSGRHVLSETTACFSPSEGVDLVRAATDSSKVYMLAENYAYFASNLEMKRLYETGELGEVKFAEGEYVHPMPSGFQNSIAPGLNHWRNWMPITFYCTHSLAPILHITGLRPTRVSALAIPRDPDDLQHFGETVRVNDTASVFLVQLENGTVAKILWGQLRGLGAWVSLRCGRGMVENLRTGNPRMIRIAREPFDLRSGESLEEIYLPDFPPPFSGYEADPVMGADLFVYLDFVAAVRGEKEPFFDVHRSVEMSMTGIQAYRSALSGGDSFDIPNFRVQEDLARYAEDNWRVDPRNRGEDAPPPSVLGWVDPGGRALEKARADWRDIGYSEEE